MLADRILERSLRENFSQSSWREVLFSVALHSVDVAVLSRLSENPTTDTKSTSVTSSTAPCGRILQDSLLPVRPRRGTSLTRAQVMVSCSIYTIHLSTPLDYMKRDTITKIRVHRQLDRSNPIESGLSFNRRSRY